MAQYVDGFVIPILKKNVKAYVKMAKLGAKVWKDHGALDYRECVGEDLKNAWGISFPKLAKTKTGETVIFAYIVFKSRAHRDAVNAKVMKDPRMKCDMKDMPFNVKRMAYGGFETLVR